MRARSAEYVTSAAAPTGFPPLGAPEIAFAGRSNVGKSSLLNSLTGQKSLARTSGTPGRTQLLNWFRIASPKGVPLFFVDLPGFGFAKVPVGVRRSWGPLIEEYLAERDTLALVLLLIDLRRGPEAEELDLAAWLTQANVPFHIVMTKADQLPKAKRMLAGTAAKKAMGLRREPILFSAKDGTGADDIWRVLEAATRPAKKTTGGAVD